MKMNRRAGDSTDIVVEPDFARIAVLTFLFGGLIAMLAYFWVGAAAGEGLSLFQVIGTLAVLLALVAAANRRRPWLRLLLFLWALGFGALLVDQLAYVQWHRKVDRLVGGLQASASTASPSLGKSMPLPPTAIRIDKDRDVVLTFEPPLLAWTYRADASSPAAHALIAGWYSALKRLVQHGTPDRIARMIVTPHRAYSVKVASSETAQTQRAANWVVAQAL